MQATMFENTLPNQSDIIAQINIEGLFVLCIDQTNQIAQFGVYELASRHSLSLRVFEILKTNMDDPETLYNPCISFDNMPPGDIVINALGAAKLKVYKSDMADSETLFKTNNFSSPNDDHARDYRWIANLDDAKFREDLFEMPPGANVSMLSGIISRKVQVSHGVLYTGDYADRFIKWAFESLATNNNPPKLWKRARLARMISIAVPRGNNSINSIALSIGNSPSTNQYAMSLPVKSDSHYEINITNLCHDIEDPDLRKHGDFQLYYNVIPIDIDKRIDFLPMFGTGTDRTPCDPIFLEGTQVMP